MKNFSRLIQSMPANRELMANRLRSTMKFPAIFLALFLLGGHSLLSFLAPPPSSAYYLEQAKNYPLLIREDAPAEQDSPGKYALQDNLHLFTPSDTKTAFLLPLSEYFIAADIVDINLPIFSLFRNPSGLGQDPLANILYADLKTKNLLEEYQKVRERAASVSGGRYRTDENMTEDLRSRLPQTTTPDNDNDPDDELRQRIEALQRNLPLYTAPEIRPLYSQSNSSPDAADDRNIIISLQELQLLRKQHIRQSSTNNTKAVGDLATKSDFPPSSGHPLSVSKTTQDSQAIYDTSDTGSLPLIIKLPIKLYNFAVEHKTFSLTSGLIIMFLLSIFFGSRS